MMSSDKPAKGGSPMESFAGADRDGEAFGTGQGALNTIGSQKGLTLEFKRQRDVQQIEAATAKAPGMFCGKRAGDLNCPVHVDRDFNENATRYEL